MALTKLTSVDKSVAKKLLSELPIQVSTVAEMKTKSYEVGQVVETVGYYAEGDAGAARYLVKAAQAFDGYGDHVLANGTVAVLQVGSIIDVLQFGVILDYSTDNTPALQAANDYLEGIGGGEMVIPTTSTGNECGINSPINQSSLVKISGINDIASCIKALLTFTGSAMVKSKGFDTLTGQNKWLTSDGVTYGQALEDLILDGAQLAIIGVQYYAKRFTLNNFFINNCWSGGWYSEAGAIGGQENITDVPESDVNLKTFGCKGYAFDYRGPHDGRINTLYCSGNNFTGTKGVRFIKDAVSNGLASIGEIHTYGMASDNFYTSSALIGGTIIAESCPIRNCIIDSSTNELSEVIVFGRRDDTENMLNIKGSQNKFKVKAIDNADSLTGNLVVIEGNENVIDISNNGQGSGCIGLVNSGRGNKIRGSVTACSTGLRMPDETKDGQMDLQIRDCVSVWNIGSLNVTNNVLNLGGFGNTNLGSGFFSENNNVFGTVVLSTGSTRFKSQGVAVGVIDMTLLTSQVIDIPHGLASTPTIGKCKVTISGAGSTTHEERYSLRMQYVDSTKIRVGYRLNVAGTGVGDVAWEAQV